MPIPCGYYVPDWAILTEDGRKLIAETKGSKDSLQLTLSEKAKISCAKKFFMSAGIDYKVEDSFDGIMSHVVNRSES